MTAVDYRTCATGLAADHLSHLAIIQVNGLGDSAWVVPVANCEQGFWDAFAATETQRSEAIYNWVT